MCNKAEEGCLGFRIRKNGTKGTVPTVPFWKSGTKGTVPPVPICTVPTVLF